MGVKETARMKDRKRRREGEERWDENRRNERATEAKWRGSIAAGGGGDGEEEEEEVRIAGNARRERRALHFIAAASSLFIADTTLRHISSVFPAGSPAIRAPVRKKEKEIKSERRIETERERVKESRMKVEAMRSKGQRRGRLIPQECLEHAG